ncbi:hypothetical protein FGO68_gene15087 [Halteria grandinella]|uniref:Uncharacterized protein n=1 Tax=Halteria grandinella TaxID=5974 RepID=A0A8J8T4N7_HALGN|nr:hypothetical protein FGO68_gene15087 [Halteria grandinella]
MYYNDATLSPFGLQICKFQRLQGINKIYCELPLRFHFIHFNLLAVVIKCLPHQMLLWWQFGRLLHLLKRIRTS